MEIHAVTSGRFHPAEFSLTSSVVNNYIPLINVSNNDIHIDLPGEIMYSKPSIEPSQCATSSGSIRKILDALKIRNQCVKMVINEKTYFMAKGLILNSKGQVMFLLALKKEAWLNPNVANFKVNQTATKVYSDSNYVAFYSSTFITNPELAQLNRRLQKDVILSCLTKGIEVRLLDPAEIEKNTFARTFEVNFNSIPEMDTYIRENLPTLLYDKREDTLFREKKIYSEPTPLAEEAQLMGYEIPDGWQAMEEEGSSTSIRYVDPHPGRAIQYMDSEGNMGPVQTIPWEEAAPPPTFMGRGIIAQMEESATVTTYGEFNQEILEEVLQDIVGSRESLTIHTPRRRRSTESTILLIDDVD